MRNYTRYTREMLEPLVKDSVTVAEVLRKLGKRQTGSIATHLSKTIKRLGIDMSHFLGMAANRGKSSPVRLPWEKVLVCKEGMTRREAPFRLRRALLESGREYRCEICQNSEWMGKQLLLQVDHKNGQWFDNRPENIRFCCPNCHSQTEGHSGSKGYTELTSDTNYQRIYRKRSPGGGKADAQR